MLTTENFYITSLSSISIYLYRNKKKLKGTPDIFLLLRLLLKFYSKLITKFPMLSDVIVMFSDFLKSSQNVPWIVLQKLRMFCRWKYYCRIHVESNFCFTSPFSAWPSLAENKQKICLICFKASDGVLGVLLISLNFSLG